MKEMTDQERISAERDFASSRQNRCSAEKNRCSAERGQAQPFRLTSRISMPSLVALTLGLVALLDGDQKLAVLERGRDARQKEGK
jgi:F0F1-type ATP synthase assembly protein I